MHAIVQSAPLIISDNTEKEMTPTTADLCSLILKKGRPTKNIPWCQQYINIGVFFDGTDNNRYRDEPLQSHTNIVKLFNAHKSADGQGWMQAPGHYRIYVPGLGTPFPENNEWRETMEGKAFGKGGQARILYALLEVYNAVYRTFDQNKKKFNDKDIAAKLKQYTREIDTGDPLSDAHEPRPDRRSWFKGLSDELDIALRLARKDRPLPKIPKISLSVFGFSRGAMQARAFCYWFNDLLAKDGTFAGMPASIEFLGLFDCVASTGMSQSAAETTPAFWADGHWAWANETLSPLPACVEQTVHFSGGHEQRRNFPLTRVQGKNVTEVIYPGVHADVGGGYAPGDHGRGIKNGKGELDMLLSQVPLAHMYLAASKAGVPLVNYCVMESDLKEDYAINPKLAIAWNDYMAAGKTDFEGDPERKIVPTFHSIVRQHMRLYYCFRRLRLEGLTNSVGYNRANQQEQHNMQSYNALLKGDVKLLTKRAQLAADERNGRDSFGRDVHGRPSLRFAAENHGVANAWQLRLARSGVPPESNELWALGEMTKAAVPQKAPFLVLLEEYVHDSLANFYLAGYTTLEEKSEALLKMAITHHDSGKAPSTPYRSRVWQNYQKGIKDNPQLDAILQSRVDTLEAADNMSNYRNGEIDPQTRRPYAYYRADKIQATQSSRQQTVFSKDEQATLARFYPLQTDADVAELRSPFIVTQTNTRREGSGYLRQRHIFE